MLRAGEIAEGMSSKTSVVNLLQLPGGSESQQVMLQVRIAEVNRRAIQELGVSLFSTRPDATGRVTTQQFSGPGFDDGKKGGLVFGDFLNLFFFNGKEGLGAVIKALEEKGLFQSLAEPNLIAYNGQEASFLAGGEFPVPVVQGATGAVTIVFKEFGVRLNFRPTIAGDVIRLKVRPEVSSLDYNNGITLEGFRIPSLIMRRAETDVELRDGQSFAIAGLLNNITQTDGANIPFLSKIPIIGYLFKSKAERKERTELMVLVTPRLVRPLNPDEVPSLPTMPGRFLSNDDDNAVDAPPANSKAEGQMTAQRASDRGAVLVQVAIAILVMTAMATFVVDQGVVWVSRGQAQNAADAGALSGAIARAYDEFTSPPASNGKAFKSAVGAARANEVWTTVPTAQVSWACPAGVTGSCVRVDVYRNGDFGSTPLPTIFGRVLNIPSQGVRATATAVAAAANQSSNCLRPWMIPDTWTENTAPTSQFNGTDVYDVHPTR